MGEGGKRVNFFMGLAQLFGHYCNTIKVQRSWSIGIHLMLYLSYDGLSSTVVLVEEVVCLDEELAGVFLSLSGSTLPQDHWPCYILLFVHCMLSVLFLQEAKSKNLSAWKYQHNTSSNPSKNPLLSVVTFRYATVGTGSRKIPEKQNRKARNSPEHRVIQVLCRRQGCFTCSVQE